MSEDEKKVEETTQPAVNADAATGASAGTPDPATPDAASAEASKPADPSKKKKHRRLGITLGVVAAIVIVAGSAFWVWHEQPSFCNAICHAPMDPANETYEGVSGESGVDKWGNYVEDMGTLMVVQHKEGGDLVCLDCHVPTIDQQVGEVVHWVGGTYGYPLDERSLSELNAYNKFPDSAEFCMNDRCHNMTRDDLARATGGTKYNPHVTAVNHDQMECSDCHKAHRQSVMACTRCHTTDEVDVPAGWLTAEESAKITSENFPW